MDAKAADRGHICLLVSAGIPCWRFTGAKRRIYRRRAPGDAMTTLLLTLVIGAIVSVAAPIAIIYLMTRDEADDWDE